MTLSSTSRTLLAPHGLHHLQAGYPHGIPRNVEIMLRIIGFIVAAVALFVVLWLLFWGLVHALTIGFWIVLVVLLCSGLFRMGRWSRRSR